MTIPQLHRLVADLTEELEAANIRIAELEAENSALKAKVPTDEKQWFSTEEAGKFLGKKPSFLRNNRHLIPYRKDGHRTVIYNREDLIKYAESNTKKCRLKKGEHQK